MTLKSIMSADVNTVFLNEDEFAEQWTWVPACVGSNAQQIVAVDVSDALEGTREVSGDGRALNRVEGTIIRESVILEISTAYVITEPKGTGQTADQFIDPGGVVYVVKRVTGRDDDMQSVLVVRAKRQITRQGERRG